MDWAKEIRLAMTVIAAELSEEFDRNFERKAFFDKAWPKSDNGLVDTGELRRSIETVAKDRSVEIYSDKVYAAIHNDGGKIKITAKMHAFFWAKYKSTKKEIWSALGKKKVGSYIVMPQRQYIGEHPQVTKSVENVIADRLEKSMVKNIEILIKKK